MHPRTAVAFPHWMITETRCARYWWVMWSSVTLFMRRTSSRKKLHASWPNTPIISTAIGTKKVPEKGGNTSKSSCIPHLGPWNQPLLKSEMNVKVPWCLGMRYPKLESYHPSMAQLRLHLVSCHQTDRDHLAPDGMESRPTIMLS